MFFHLKSSSLLLKRHSFTILKNENVKSHFLLVFKLFCGAPAFGTIRAERGHGGCLQVCLVCHLAEELFVGN